MSQLPSRGSPESCRRSKWSPKNVNLSNGKNKSNHLKVFQSYKPKSLLFLLFLLFLLLLLLLVCNIFLEVAYQLTSLLFSTPWSIPWPSSDRKPPRQDHPRVLWRKRKAIFESEQVKRNHRNPLLWCIWVKMISQISRYYLYPNDFNWCSIITLFLLENRPTSW